MKHLWIAPCLVFALMINGCATDVSSNSYTDEQVGEAAQSYRGVVLKVRKVNITPDKLGKSETGTLAGGAAGAVAGSQFGSGTGKLIMTAGGAVAGALGGAYAEKALKSQIGLEITIELKNGNIRTVVQGSDVPFSKGENVLLMVYNKGRSKVVKI